MLTDRGERVERRDLETDRQRQMLTDRGQETDRQTRCESEG